MEKTKRIYPSQQLVCCLDSKVLKTFMWLCGWQSQGDIKLYVKQMSKFLHLTEEEVELCIQTLENVHLIGIKKVDQTYIANINAEQVDKYFKIPISKIAEGDGIPMATEVKWNVEDEKTSSIEDMTEQQIQSMILRLQAQLNEKRQVKKMIKSNDDDIVSLFEIKDKLPF